MGKLLSILGAQSRKRGLIRFRKTVDARAAFALMRDTPYQRSSTMEPEAIIQEWRGICSGKHYFLDQIFREEGLGSRVIMRTHRFAEETTADFPPGLREVVAQGSVPDNHTCIRPNIETGWMTVAVTRPIKAASLGMTVNGVFELGNDTTLACSPMETYEVPGGRDPQEFKEEFIEIFCGSQTDDRDRFINGLSEWLSKHTS